MDEYDIIAQEMHDSLYDPLPDGLVEPEWLELPALEPDWLELPAIEQDWLELPEIEPDWLNMPEMEHELPEHDLDDWGR